MLYILANFDLYLTHTLEGLFSMTVTALTLSHIRTAIAQAVRFVDKITPNVYNLHTLWLSVTATEFFNEINFLDQWLITPPEQIKAEFIARCAIRQSTSEKFISFADNPATHTNRLYLQIATLLFNPVDLQALLAILMPNTQRCVRLNPYNAPATHLASDERNDFYLLEPSDIQIGSMALLAGVPITKEAIDECVFFEDAVFPFQINPSTQLSLKWHVKFHRELSVYPELFQKLYAHNDEYQILAEHIYQANDGGGRTAREMITLLIKGLKSGGFAVLGNEDLAGLPAMHAIVHFFEYYHALPEDIRAALSLLPTQDFRFPTLGDILTVMNNPKINIDQTCVEVGAINLGKVLTVNKENSLLNYRSPISQLTYDNLDAHYKKTSLSTLRGSDTVKVFPLDLVSTIFSRVQIYQSAVLVLLLREFPIQIVEILLSNIKLFSSNDLFQNVRLDLLNAFQHNLLTDEHKVALLEASFDACENPNKNLAHFIPFQNVLFLTLPKATRLAMLSTRPSTAKFAAYFRFFENIPVAYKESREEVYQTLSQTTALELIDDIDAFFSLLRMHSSSQFLSVLCGGQRNLRPLAIVEANITHYLTIINNLRECDEISFLGLKTSTGTRVIDLLVQSDVIAEAVSESPIHSNNTLGEVLKLLCDKNLTQVDGLIELALSQKSLKDIKVVLTALLRQELTQPRYFLTSTENKYTLIDFYKNHKIKLTEKECYDAILTAAKRQPSFDNFNYIETLLKKFFRFSQDFSQPEDRLKTLFLATLKQSLIPTEKHGVVFNPTMLFAFVARFHSSFHSVCFASFELGAPINRTLTVSELVKEALFYIDDSLLQAPNLISNIYADLTGDKYGYSNVFHKFDSELQKLYSQPKYKASIVKTIISELMNHYASFNFSTYRELLTIYFDILHLSQKPGHSREQLAAYFAELLPTLSVIQRLVLLNINPPYVNITLKELYGDMIKPIIQGIHKASNLEHDNAAMLEEYLQFIETDLSRFVKGVFIDNKAEVIEHLLTTRITALRELNQKNNLLALYLKLGELLPNSLILYRLHQSNFTFTDAAPFITQARLNACLRTVAISLPSILEDEPGATVLIDALVKAGADVNAADNDSEAPPIFSTLNTVVLSALLSHGANINFISPSGKHILQYQLSGLRLYSRDQWITQLNYLSFLLKNGLSAEIFNTPFMIGDKPTTLLSFIHNYYLKSSLKPPEVAAAQACLMAAIKAGANPVFFAGSQCAYVKFSQLHPQCEALSVYEPQYRRMAVKSAEFIRIRNALDQAITAYTNAQRELADNLPDTSMRHRFLAYDLENKVLHLEKALGLFDCAYSLDTLHTALKALIEIFFDSTVKGIITVARQPDLPSHQIFYKLIETIYPGEYTLRILRNNPQRRELKRYFARSVPTRLLIGCDPAEFMRELHPTEFANINFLKWFESIKAQDASFIDKLTTNQAKALFKRLFHLYAKVPTTKPLYTLVTAPIKAMSNPAAMKLFFTHLYQASNNQYMHMILSYTSTFPEHHRQAFFGAIPTEQLFTKLFSCLIDEFNMIASVLIKEQQPFFTQPFQSDDEAALSRFENETQLLYQKLPKNSASDTVFHAVARRGASPVQLRELFSQIRSWQDVIGILLMQNAHGQSVMALLRDSSFELKSTLMGLFIQYNEKSLSLSQSSLKALCFHMPELFFPILQMDCTVACMHARYQGKLLLDHALSATKIIPYDPTLFLFPPQYRNYFALRLSLLKQASHSPSLYAPKKELVEENVAQLNKLASYTNSTLFDHIEESVGEESETIINSFSPLKG